MQPRDRWHRQRPPRAGDRRHGRRHGPGCGRGGHPVPRPQPAQGAGGAWPPSPGRPPPLQEGHERGACRPAGPRTSRRRGRGSDGARQRGRRREGRGRRLVALRRRGIDHRHFLARPDPHGRGKDSGGTRRGRPFPRTLGDAGTARIQARPPKDRDAPAARRQHHRLGWARCSDRRRPACPVLLHERWHRHTADRLPSDRHDAGDPRTDTRQSAPRADVLGSDRRHRPTLLSIDRGQGRALCGAAATPDIPRTRRARRRYGVPQRDLDLPAARSKRRCWRVFPASSAR